MLARNFSCWLETFHAGSKLFMLARNFSCWLENERAGLKMSGLASQAFIFKPARSFSSQHLNFVPFTSVDVESRSTLYKVLCRGVVLTYVGIKNYHQ